MKNILDITIAGGGMTGLGLAALLAADDRVKIRVIDAGPAPLFDPDGPVGLRVAALAPASVDLLEAAGAWDSIRSRRACAYDRMQVWDAGASPGGASTVVFDAAEFARGELGFIVENELVRAGLYDALLGTQVLMDFDTSIDVIERRDAGWRLQLGSGIVETDLLIGADGGRSLVREAAGIDTARHDYAQTALVTHVRPEQPHNHTAWQRFLTTGPIGLLPLEDGRVSIVWSTTPAEVEAALAMSDEELGVTLTRVSDQALGRLTVEGPRGAFPLAASHASRYVEAGLALVGDAAHAVHPLAGQGVNLGFADVDELVGVIREALDAGEYPADRPVLRRYERRRRGANAGMIRLLTGLNALFASDSAVIGGLRRAGMQLFNRSGPVRHQAVEVALGDTRRSR